MGGIYGWPLLVEGGLRHTGRKKHEKGDFSGLERCSLRGAGKNRQRQGFARELILSKLSDMCRSIWAEEAARRQNKTKNVGLTCVGSRAAREDTQNPQFSQAFCKARW